MTYYGDNNRWFFGNVISIDDPLALGRVKVRIFGIHSENVEDIPEADLPWAQVVIPITEGGQSGLGTNIGIKEHAQVYGIFLDGVNSQLPLVIGSISRIENPPVPAPTADEEDPLIGTTNAEKAYNWFISKEGGDFSSVQSAGIVGNLMQESGQDLNPLALNQSEGSFGIAQWNPAEVAGNRLGSLKDYCRENNLNYESLYGQLRFITYELFNIPYERDYALKKLLVAKTVEQASLAFEWYERPEGWSRSTRSYSADQRIAYAEGIYKQMEIV